MGPRCVVAPRAADTAKSTRKDADPGRCAVGGFPQGARICTAGVQEKHRRDLTHEGKLLYFQTAWLPQAQLVELRFQSLERSEVRYEYRIENS